VVEGARLESVYAGNRIAGSNPAPSAMIAKLLRKNNNLESFGRADLPKFLPARARSGVGGRG
jgi:hypothetical protein